MNAGNRNNPRNPLLAVDCLVRYQQGFVLIKRENPPHGWAIPGGFVEYGETIEQAVQREIMEEIGLKLENLQQWHVFSHPDRDPRQHVVSVVFHADGRGEARASSDANDLRIVSTKAPFPDCAFDHNQILREARQEDLI